MRVRSEEQELRSKTLEAPVGDATTPSEQGKTLEGNARHLSCTSVLSSSSSCRCFQEPVSICCRSFQAEEWVFVRTSNELRTDKQASCVFIAASIRVHMVLIYYFLPNGIASNDGNVHEHSIARLHRSEHSEGEVCALTPTVRLASPVHLTESFAHSSGVKSSLLSHIYKDVLRSRVRAA